MKSEDVRIGEMVKVRKHYRIAERRGLVGKIVDRYGGEEYMAVDVRFSNGQQRLFWPEDLQEICSRPWWRSLRGSGSAE
jgi:hypothetical protein